MRTCLWPCSLVRKWSNCGDTLAVLMPTSWVISYSFKLTNHDVPPPVWKFPPPKGCCLKGNRFNESTVRGAKGTAVTTFLAYKLKGDLLVGESSRERVKLAFPHVFPKASCKASRTRKSRARFENASRMRAANKRRARRRRKEADDGDKCEMLKCSPCCYHDGCEL